MTMTTHTLNLNADLIDSRDIIEAYNELRDEAYGVIDERGLDDEHNPVGADVLLDTMLENDDLSEIEDEVDVDELKLLRDLCEEGEGIFSDWSYGVSLVADYHFETFAQDFAEDIGAIDDNARWPATCIDWEWAARELQMDYSSFDIRGTTYWGR